MLGIGQNGLRVLTHDEFEDVEHDAKQLAKRAAVGHAFTKDGCPLTVEDIALIDIDRVLHNTVSAKFEETYEPQLEALKWSYVAEFAETRKRAIRP